MKKFLLLLVIVCLVPCFGCNKQDLENSCYKIYAEYLDNGVIGAHLSFDYVCDIKDGTDVLKFNLFTNAFRKDASITPIEDNISVYGETEIISVKEKGEDLKFEICGSDKNILKVELGKIICYGEKITVDIDFGLVLPSGNFRYCKGESTVNLGNWFPMLCVYDNGAFYECEYYAIGDPFYSEVADFKVEMLVPSKMVVASSAKASSCDVSGDKTLYSYELKNARDFALVLSEKFSVISEKSGSVTVNYYYYDDSEPEKTLEVTKKSLEYFSATFGNYPYDEFSVCQSNFSEGGMEYPGLVYINDTLNLANKLYTAVHETAHQWWYGVVGNNQLTEAYLDEGLTEYSTAIFFDENKEFNISSALIFENARKSASMYGEILQSVGKETDYKMVKHLKDFSGNLEYVNTAYNRPLTMMKTIEDAIGRDKVKTVLKKYYETYKFKTVTTNELLENFSLAKKLLSSYIEGKAVV